MGPPSHRDPVVKPLGLHGHSRHRPVGEGHEVNGIRRVTTVYFSEVPPDKYQTTGRIESTNWSADQPKTDVTVIVCTHIQVVYSGVNTTSPATCAQTTFS